jgi:hypothetical protein
MERGVAAVMIDPGPKPARPTRCCPGWLEESDGYGTYAHGRNVLAAMMKKYGPKVLGLATLAGLFIAGGGSVNIR